jgi:hypothetical protein
MTLLGKWLAVRDKHNADKRWFVQRLEDLTKAYQFRLQTTQAMMDQIRKENQHDTNQTR